MSTAKAHVNKETTAYTSPRQQGAGIIDTAAAISTGLYLTGEDGYGSITWEMLKIYSALRSHFITLQTKIRLKLLNAIKH